MQIPEHVNDAYWSTYKWPRQMQVDLEDAKHRLKSVGSLITDRIDFEKNLVLLSQADIAIEISFLESLSDINQSAVAKQKILSLQELVSSTISLASSVSKQQESMGRAELHFDELDGIVHKYHRCEKLWELVDDALTCLRSWVHEWFMNLNAKLMVSKINSWNATIKELLDAFDEDSNSRRIILQLKEDVDDFWRNTNVITSLRNPALKASHWEQIKDVIGLSLIDFQSLHLSQMFDLDLELVQSVISDISLQADVSHRLEMNLEKMKSDLSTREFQVIPVFDSPYFTIANGDEAKNILEDQLLKCESFFLQTEEADSKLKIEKWTSQIHKALEMMIAIIELQEFYLQMKSIMGGTKILSLFEKTSVESFKTISKIFFLLSEVFSKNRKFINLVYRNDLYDLIIGSGSRMKNCIEGAKLFLETRRNLFPRFYFVSDNDLIETISAVNIQQLSKSIQLYFPSILKLNGSSSSISGLIGHEGEAILFLRSLDFIGDVDIVLQNIESSIILTLKSFFKRSIGILQQNNLLVITQFIEQCPLQIGLLSLRIHWSQTIRNYLMQKEKLKIKEFKSTLAQIQDSLVELCQSSISSSTRIKAESFIALTIEFLALIEEGVSQFSYINYEFDENYNITLSVNNSTKISYGFEYLGANIRNCLTPSMNYMLNRILHSISDQIGPMLYSPNGTGKMKILEEFSHIVGIRTIVEYCGDFDTTRLKLLIKGHLYSSCKLILKDIHHMGEQQLFEIDSEFEKLSGDKEVNLFPIIATTPSFNEWMGLPNKIRTKYRLTGLLEPDLQISLEAILAPYFKTYSFLAKKIVLLKSVSRSILAPYIILKIPILKKIIMVAIGMRKEYPSYQENQLLAIALLMNLKESISIH